MNWKLLYLEALSEGQMETAARKAAGVTRRQVEQERLLDPLFVEQEQAIYDVVTDSLETEAIRRARDGIDKIIFYKGEEVGAVKEYSDGLLQFLLKGRRRGVYGDKSEITGGSAIQISIRDVAAEAGIDSEEKAKNYLDSARVEAQQALAGANKHSNINAQRLSKIEAAIEANARAEKELSEFMEKHASSTYGDALIEKAGKQIAAKQISDNAREAHANALLAKHNAVYTDQQIKIGGIADGLQTQKEEIMEKRTKAQSRMDKVVLGLGLADVDVGSIDVVIKGEEF